MNGGPHISQQRASYVTPGFVANALLAAVQPDGMQSDGQFENSAAAVQLVKKLSRSGQNLAASALRVVRKMKQMQAGSMEGGQHP